MPLAKKKTAPAPTAKKTVKRAATAPTATRPRRRAGTKAAEEPTTDVDEAVAKEDRKTARAKASTKHTVGGKVPSTEVTEHDLLQLVPAGMVAAFVNDKLHEKQLAVVGLGPVPDWQGDMPELPEDIAATDHSDLSNLMSQFANAVSTATYNASLAYIEAGHYDDIAEYLENVALLDTDQSNDTKRKAEARISEPVVAARALHRSRYNDYVRFRDLSRTLEFRWKTVSRVGGFVGDEAEVEEAGAIKASTRGKAAGASPGKAKASVRRVAKR